jgi:outer membrane receptor protein involved in Fe transport
MNWTGNLAVYYTLPKGGEIRLAGNYESGYLDTIGDTPDLDEGWRPFLTLDLSVRHQVTDHLLLKAMVRNLTNANRIAVFGKDLRYRLSDLEFGQSFYLDLIFKL